MSFPITRQCDQFEGFAGDAGVYASRDRVTADVYVDHEVHDYLAGPSIHSGLHVTANRRTAGWHDTNFDPRVDAGLEYYEDNRPSLSDLYADEPRHLDDEEFDQEFPHGEPPVDEAYSHEPSTPLQPLDDMLEHNRRPLPKEPPRVGGRSFSQARLQDGLTAQAVPAVQPAAPAQPVWLGHTFAPSHRVGLPWRGTLIPGTVTHLEGQNVGIAWDDGQHSVEEPGGIRPLY